MGWGKGPHNRSSWCEAPRGAVELGCLITGLYRYPGAALLPRGITKMPRGCSVSAWDYAAAEGCPVPVWDYEAIQEIPYYPMRLSWCPGAPLCLCGSYTSSYHHMRLCSLPGTILSLCEIMQPPRGCFISAWDYEATQGLPHYPMGLSTCLCGIMQLDDTEGKPHEHESPFSSPRNWDSGDIKFPSTGCCR